MATKNAINSNIPIEVTLGGTGLVSPVDHALIVGSGATAMTELAVGATDQVLLGNDGADPTWGTVGNSALTNSSVTLSDGNNITVTGSPLSLGGTASFNLTGTTDHALQLGNATGSLTSLGLGDATKVLTSAGVGANPTWETPTVGTVTSVSGGVNISTSGTATDPVMDLDAAISGMTSVTFGNGGSVQSDTTTAHTLLIQAYDVDGTAYKPFITLTNGDTPTCDLDTDVTINSSYIYRAGGTDIPVTDGGLGVSSVTAHVLMVGDGTNAINEIAVGGTGEILTGVNTADPVWLTTGAEGKVLTSHNGTALTWETPAAATFCSDAEAIAGTESAKAVAPSNLKAKLGAQTSHGLPIGNATTGAIAWTAEPSDGQILIGETGAAPSLGTITAGTGMSVTNGDHSITLASTGTSVNNQTNSYTLVLADAGKLITMTKSTANTLTVPKNSSVAFPIGTQIAVFQGDEGATTIAAVDGDVTLKYDDADTLVLNDENASAFLMKILENTWLVGGNLKAA